MTNDLYDVNVLDRALRDCSGVVSYRRAVLIINGISDVSGLGESCSLLDGVIIPFGHRNYFLVSQFITLVTDKLDYNCEIKACNVFRLYRKLSRCASVCLVGSAHANRISRLNRIFKHKIVIGILNGKG